jgi:hypothetical protein
LDTFGHTYTNNIVDLSAVTYYFFDEYNGVTKKIFTQGVYPQPLSDLSSAMRLYISKLGGSPIVKQKQSIRMNSLFKSMKAKKYRISLMIIGGTNYLLSKSFQNRNLFSRL